MHARLISPRIYKQLRSDLNLLRHNFVFGKYDKKNHPPTNYACKRVMGNIKFIFIFFSMRQILKKYIKISKRVNIS